MPNHRHTTTPIPTSTLPRLPGKPYNGLSAEYLEAVTFLSEETMAKACSLLLSEADYENENSNGNHDDNNNSHDNPTTNNDNNNNNNNKSERSDEAQLMDLCAKCFQAVEIIDKEAAASVSTTLPPLLPSSNLPAARGALAARAQAKPLGNAPLGSSNTTGTATSATGVTTKIVPPNRRMARLPPPPPSVKASGHKHGLTRQESESSLDKSQLQPPPQRSGLTPVGKKPKIHLTNSATGSASGYSTDSSTEGSVKAPPPNARHFLAKLNKEGTTDTNVATKATSPPVSETTSVTIKPSKSKEEVNTQSPPVSPTRPPTRTQPPRASRKS